MPSTLLFNKFDTVRYCMIHLKTTFINLQNEFLLKDIGQELLMLNNSV